MVALLTKRSKPDKFEKNQDERIALDLINDIESFLKNENIPDEKVAGVITLLIEKLKGYDMDFASAFIRILNDSDISKKYHIKV